jgi:hypothetical protein
VTIAQATSTEPRQISAATLYRLSGLALLIAGLLQVVGWLTHPPGERLVDLLSPLQGPSHLLMFVSWLFALLGLPGLYARQAHRAGLLGLIGFVATIFAVAYHCYLVLYEAYPAVWLARNEATGDLIATGGPLAHGAGALGPFAFATILAFPLLGIATVRARVLPRWTGWLQIACVPAFLAGALGLALILPPGVPDGIPGPIQPIAVLYYLLFAGYAGGGYALWAKSDRAREPVVQPGVQQPAI